MKNPISLMNYYIYRFIVAGPPPPGINQVRTPSGVARTMSGVAGGPAKY